MPAKLLAGRALCAERGWGGAAVVLGLEDLQALPHHQGARERLHRRRVEPPGELQGRHLQLGRPDQVLGLSCALQLHTLVQACHGICTMLQCMHALILMGR